MAIQAPLFAVRRLLSGRWLLLAPSDDPFLLAAVVVATVDEPVGTPRLAGVLVKNGGKQVVLGDDFEQFGDVGLDR
jgi:hypothetical protein